MGILSGDGVWANMVVWVEDVIVDGILPIDR